MIGLMRVRGRRRPREDGERAPRSRTFAPPALALALLLLSASGALANPAAPSAVSEAASRVSKHSAQLNAKVNPNGARVGECYFEWGTTPALGQTAPCSYSAGFRETPVPVLAVLEGLSESTTYYFRIHARNEQGEAIGEELSFTTPPGAPASRVEAVRTVGHTSATLQGLVTPDEAEVNGCYFEYGTTPLLGASVPCEGAVGGGLEPVGVRATVAGLTESTTYYFRLVSANAFGAASSDQESFTTLPTKPRASTEPAHLITHTSAKLAGVVNPDGALLVTCYFQWGTSEAYGQTIPCETMPGSAEEPALLSAELTGLNESTTYDFQLVAGNGLGQDAGVNRHFTTLPANPRARILKPGEVAETSALLKASVSPRGSAISECVFEYGTTPALEQSAPCSSMPSEGESFAKVTAPVSELQPDTAYLVRLKARNQFGSYYSGTESFTTVRTGTLPLVTRVRPPKGPSAGGNQVLIRGKNLSGATAVDFGEAPAPQILADGAESIEVLAPEGVGTVDVTVITGNGESAITSADRYTYGRPTIAALSPAGGPMAGGTEVTVSGTGFEPGATGFTFGGIPASAVECTSTTECTAIAPAGTKPGGVSVRATVNGRASPKGPAARFTYM